MTRETFDAGMELLMKQWPNHQLSPDVYWTVLRDMDDGVFQRAILACLESCKFFPVIAEIREKAVAVLNAAGALPAQGEHAWARLMELRRYWSPDNGWCAPVLWEDGKPRWGEVGGPNGYYGAPSPLDELTTTAVHALGGLQRVYCADDHDLGFIRREFLEFYDHKREMELAYNPGLLRQALPDATPGHILKLLEGRR